MDRHKKPLREASWRNRAPGGLLSAMIAATIATSALAQAPGRPELIDDLTVPVTAIEQDDGPTYPVGGIDLRYLRQNAGHPPIADVMALPIALGRTSSGYVRAREGVPSVTETLADYAGQPTETYHATAIQSMLEQIRDYYVAQDLLGVFVAPDPTQISENGLDLRDGDPRLTIVVTTGIVTELRTIASGERVREGGRITPQNRIDNPLHASILERSPFRPAGDDPDTGDLLRKSELDDYLFFLGRHIGRRADGAVSAGQDIGGLALDYLITEYRPLLFYAQVSNTGTKSTNYWRQRVGLIHSQLTNNDDVLSLDYTTANFDEVNAFTGSYDRPFPNPRVRWRIQGQYSQYDATQLGFFNDIFKGKTGSFGGEIQWNFYQNRELFLDLIGGLRYDDLEVDNQAFGIKGDANLLFPYIGLRLDRTTEWYSTQAAVTLDAQWAGLTGVDEAELTRLGRLLPSENWAVLRWDLSHSVFLEPLFDREGWEDPNTPESSKLANELYLRFHGQWAFNNRLIPQSQAIVGGLYTVRGYPQSVVAADTAVIATAEYRFHVPRAFEVESEPRDLFGRAFRLAPQYVYGVPDWDLVLKAFVDYGSTYISDKLFFEDDETLLGIGVGVDLLYKRNVSVRLDWGFVMDAIENRDVNSGSNRLSVVATFIF